MASAQVRAFALLGDSNIQRHINKTSVRAHPDLKKAQVLPCGHLDIFAETLGKIKPDVNVSILSCLTNFITSADGPSTVSHRIDPILKTIHSILVEFCSAHPDRLCLLSPPMYRTSPLWYREGLPEVLNLFSQTFASDRPPNLHILSSFPTPEYESDGVHLTAYSGLEFILHLFDSSHELFTMLESSVDELVVRSCESTRVLEDRMMVLEQDHRRLNRVVEHKTAIDAELSDFHANERFEDSFVIFGLAPIPSNLSGKDWQTQALKDVQAILLILLKREFPIVVVQNATSRAPKAEVKYNVRMVNVADSKLIRTTFGTFFTGSKDGRPDDLKHVNIKIRTTPQTKTRVEILKLLAQKYRDSNPDGRAQVVSHEPRPMIKITPPPNAKDKRIRLMNYVEAVKRLPTNFTTDEITPILRRMDPEWLGQVRVFTLLSSEAWV